LASRNLFSSPLDLRATNTHILADGTSHSSLEAVANLVQVHHGVSKDPVEVTDPLPRSETEQEASQENTKHKTQTQCEAAIENACKQLD
jgi:hypothetical protein